MYSCLALDPVRPASSFNDWIKVQQIPCNSLRHWHCETTTPSIASITSLLVDWSLMNLNIKNAFLLLKRQIGDARERRRWKLNVKLAAGERVKENDQRSKSGQCWYHSWTNSDAVIRSPDVSTNFAFVFVEGRPTVDASQRTFELHQR